MNTFLNVLMSFLFNSVIVFGIIICLIHVLSLSQNVQHFPLGLCNGAHHSTYYDHILDKGAVLNHYSSHVQWCI